MSSLSYYCQCIPSSTLTATQVRRKPLLQTHSKVRTIYQNCFKRLYHIQILIYSALAAVFVLVQHQAERLSALCSEHNKSFMQPWQYSSTLTRHQPTRRLQVIGILGMQPSFEIICRSRKWMRCIWVIFSHIEDVLHQQATLLVAVPLIPTSSSSTFGWQIASANLSHVLGGLSSSCKFPANWRAFKGLLGLDLPKICQFSIAP